MDGTVIDGMVYVGQAGVIYHLLMLSIPPPPQKTGRCHYCGKDTVWTENQGWIHAESGEKNSNEPFVHGVLVTFISPRPGVLVATAPNSDEVL